MRQLLLCLALSGASIASPAWADPAPSPKKGAACVHEAARQLGLDSLTETDPALMEEIYDREMFLLDFDPLWQKALPYFAKPMPLAPFIGQVKKGIIRNHPAMVEFLCEALSRGLFAGSEAYAPRIKRMVHHTFLLDLLVNEMLADLDFMKATHRYFVEKRREFGVPDSFLTSALVIYDATHSPFETAKMLTVDQTILQYIDYRTRVALGPKDLKGKNRGLLLNVMEATLAGLAEGYHENSLVGSVLAVNPVKQLSVEGPRGDVKQRFTPGWAELYQTWNFAFITGNLHDLDLMMPKLLVPLLVNAEAEDYLYRRGVTLWVTGSVVLLNKLKYENRVGLGPFPEAARIWGRINLRHAEAVNKASGSPEKIGEGLLKRMQNTFLALLQEGQAE